MTVTHDPEGWDAWARSIVVLEEMKRDNVPVSMLADYQDAVTELEQAVARYATTRADTDMSLARLDRWRRHWHRFLIAWVFLIIILAIASCAPSPAEPMTPDLGEWATVTARPGLTPSHVGACVPDIDTTVAAELVETRNAATYPYGPLPQAGHPYDVPLSTITCEGVTG